MDKAKLRELISSLCPDDCNEDFSFLLKKFIHSTYYKQIKKLIPPEIRRWIFSECTEDHLYSSALIIYNLSKKQFLCDCDPTHNPLYFTLNTFKIICNECNFSNEETHKISTSNKIQQLYNKVKNSIELTSFTKFEYTSRINNLSSYELLIHIKNLLSLGTISSLRCCICTKTLSYGYKTGVKTSCGHYSCIYCLISKEQLNCVLCKKFFDLKRNYMKFDPNIDLTCYGLKSRHNLLLNNKNIKKFNCGHLTCESHMNSNYCFKCEIDVTKIKDSEKMTRMRDFLQVKCRSHFMPINRFDLFTCKIFCDKCDNKVYSSDDENLTISYDLGKFYLILQSYFLICFDKMKELDVNLNERLLKSIQYCKILKADDLNSLVKELSIISGFSPISVNNKSITKFFDYSTKKSRIITIDSNHNFGFYFKVKSARILSGLIISKSVKKYQDLYVDDSDSGPINITISSVKNTKIILNQTYCGQLLQEENEIPINPSIYLLESETFIFQVSSSGQFLSAKPISRYTTPGLEISTIPKSENLNHLTKLTFPCFILGFIFSGLI